MRATRYLLDASALYPLVLELREKILLYKDLFTVLDLTIYEVGNTIWRGYRRGRIRDPLLASQMFMEILNEIEKLDINNDLCEVQRIAVKNNISFYDAAYIYAAKKHGLKLVTEDNDLLKFPNSVKINMLRTEI